MFKADRSVFYGVKQCCMGKNNVKSQERSKQTTELSRKHGIELDAQYIFDGRFARTAPPLQGGWEGWGQRTRR